MPGDSPPIKSEKTGNIPEPPDRLLGREAELEQLTEHLQHDRLVTLTGFGGTGKTRLALELGRLSTGQFQDGAWFQELAPITDAGVLDREAASLFGIGEDGLDSYLADKQLLFIVDNCEHVLAGATSLVQRLLSSAGVTVIATSREALNLEGERAFQVLPLPVPEDKVDPGTSFEFASVQLFQRRARAASPSFELTAENAGSVNQIVRRLDGIPLAIELAASRVKLLPPADIASRLDECFKLLRGGPVDALPHHQTLELAIDWSYDMLSPDQQQLFRRLSVFRGGFTFAAAAAISGTDDEYEVLDSLGQLVDKSMVQAVHTGGEVRYHLLEPLIQYAAARMHADEAAESGGRHANYFMDLAEQAAPELRGPSQLEWLERLEIEHDNLRFAMAWGMEAGHVDLAQRIAADLAWFWIIRRHVTEAAEWYNRVLAADRGSSKVRASALSNAGFVSSLMNDLDECLARIREAQAQFVDLGDEQGLKTAQTYEAIILWYQRDFEASTPRFAEVQAAHQSYAFEWGDAFCEWFLGSAAWFAGEITQAFEHNSRSFQTRRRRTAMVTSLDAVNSIHQAFRNDMRAIDDAAYEAAAGDGNLSPAVERLRFFSEVLKWHADGEEELVFPAMDRVAPLVAQGYLHDHNEFDTMTEGLAKITAASDALVAARETAALTAVLRIHLDKEDVYLYPILRERTSGEDQASIVGGMARHVPPERTPEFIRWFFPLLGHDDRETWTRVVMGLMPEPVFAGVKPLIRDALTDDWAELTRRIPELDF